MVDSIILNSLFLIGAILIIWKIMFSFRQKGVSFLSLPGNKLVTLKSKREITHDTILLTFSLPNEHMYLGIEVGQHVRV